MGGRDLVVLSPHQPIYLPTLRVIRFTHLRIPEPFFAFSRRPRFGYSMVSTNILRRGVFCTNSWLACLILPSNFGGHGSHSGSVLFCFYHYRGKEWPLTMALTDGTHDHVIHQRRLDGPNCIYGLYCIRIHCACCI